MRDSNYWDTLYESGDFRHWETEYPSPELASLVATGYLRNGAKILDVGCGGGLDAIFLSQYGFRVIAVDFSKSALKIAEKRASKAGVKIDWRIGSVLNLPVEKETIHLVTDRGLFHLIEDVDRPKYASELFRVLKLHGSVLIRGGSAKVGRSRFNPVTEQAIAKYFPRRNFDRGPVVSIPLFSSVGALDSSIVMLRKISK